MQLDNSIFSYYSRKFVLSLILLISLVLLWLNSATHELCVELDIKLFTILNKSLDNNQILQFIFGILNHKLETKLNLIIMIVVNLLSIFRYPNGHRLKVFFQVLFFWAFFQIGFEIQQPYFEHYLEIARKSPTAVLDECVRLSHILKNPKIKDISNCCFPSGHAMALTFWLCFSSLYTKGRARILITIVGLFMLLPRVVSGAHWVSDIIFSSVLSLSWFYLSMVVLGLFTKVPTISIEEDEQLHIF